MTDTNEDTGMGLGFKKKNAHSGGIYFRVFDGMICQTQKVANEETSVDGWEGPIKTQHPQTKKDVFTCVIRYDTLAAYLIDANKFSKQFTPEQGGGKINGLNLTLDAGGKRGILQLNWQQTGPEPVLKRFLKVAPNINFDIPILVSAWKQDGKKQAVSFKQGTDPDPDKWTKVDEYWRRDVDPVTKEAIGPQKGADGTVLPQPVHDDFNDTWDYRDQNKFLMQYFMEKVLPKIKEVAARHDLSTPPNGEATEQAQDAPIDTIPVVTTRPENPKATGLADLATGHQRATIKALSQAIGMDFEQQCPQILGCTFDELSKTGAAYAEYKLRDIAKSRNVAVIAPPTVDPTPAPPAVDDWGSATAAVTAPATPAQQPSVSPEAAPWD